LESILTSNQAKMSKFKKVQIATNNSNKKRISRRIP